jgi:hypothetical protein
MLVTYILLHRNPIPPAHPSVLQPPQTALEGPAFQEVATL